jgi:hypothetical protein
LKNKEARIQNLKQRGRSEMKKLAKGKEGEEKRFLLTSQPINLWQQ